MSDLLARIAGEIGRSGPMPFDRFMSFALYDPRGGFFTSGELRSDTGGDFLTSPEVSPAFGAAIATHVRSEMQRIGRPFTLVEAGAGSGSLLRPLLDELPEAPDHVIGVEVSPAALASLGEGVPEADIVDSMPTVGRGVVVANELLDNLPAALAHHTEDGWCERMVGVDDGVLVVVETAPREAVAAWLHRHAAAAPTGSVIEVQMEATEWVASVCADIDEGSLVIVDYGNTFEGLAHRRGEGTLRTYKRHHLGPDPLLAPGATDITMDVDFSAIARSASDVGWTTEVLRQDEWLERLGLRDRLSELRHHALELAREQRVMEQMVVKSEITAIETLLHPRGLGDFRVLVATAPSG